MKKILYVENEPLNARLMERYLDGLPVEFTHAQTAFEGLRIAQKKAFDLILLDVLLPDSDINTFVHKLYDPIRAANQQTPIYILTAYATKEHEQRLQSLDCEKYFSKPVPMGLFRDSVSETLQL